MPKSVHSHVKVSFSCSRGHRAGSCPRHKGEPSNHAGTEEEGGLFWAVSCTGWSLGVSLLWLLSGNELPRSGRVPASAQPSTNYPLCLLKQSDWNHKGLILLIPPKHCPLLFFPPHLLFVFAKFCWPYCHTSSIPLSAWKRSRLSILLLSGLQEHVCVHVPIRPTCTATLCFWRIGYFGESRMM